MAVALYEKAGAIWKEANDPVQYAITRDNLGALRRGSGDGRGAERLHREATGLFLKHLGERHPTTAIGFSHLAASQARNENYAGAVETQLRALRSWRYNLALTASLRSEQHQLDTFRHFRHGLDAYFLYARKANTPTEQVWEQLLAWKGLTFSLQSYNRLARMVPELVEPTTELRTATARLASLAYSVPPQSEREKWRENVAKATKNREVLEEKLLSAIAKQGGKVPKSATPKTVKAALPASSVLLDFSVRREPGRASDLVVFVVRPDHPVALVELGPVAPIGDAIDRWRRAHGNPSKGAAKASDEPGKELYKLLWQPLTRGKHLEGVKLVLASPDGPLGRFPLAALPGNVAGSYLIEDVPIIVVPVPQLLPALVAARPARRKSGGSLLLVGDIDFDAPPGRSAAISPLVSPAPSTDSVLKRGPGGEKKIVRDRLLSFPWSSRNSGSRKV